MLAETTFRLPDYLVFAAYMASLVVVGFACRKRAQKNLDSYFLAERKMSGRLTGFSYAATCMNSDAITAYCGMTVISGLCICWWYISRFGLALMIGALLFAVFWRRLGIFTSPEFYECRFHGVPAITMRSWIAMRSAFIAIVAWTGSGLLGIHKVMNPVLGWDKWETFGVVVPVLLLYVLMSGYLGVVITDFIQTWVMIAAAFALMGAVWHEFGGPGGLHSALVAGFGESAVAWRPPAAHEYLGVVGILTWTAGTAIGYGGDVAPMAGAMEGQRLLSCRNPREASKMYVWTLVVLFFLLAVTTLPALGAMVKWPGLTDGRINRELAYGMLLKEYLPPGLLGLAVSGLAAAIMSTVSSNLNLGAQVFLNDVYRRLLVREASVSHYMWVGRIVMLVIMGLSLLVATSAENVINVSVFMLGLSSAEITANWGQWWWWRFNGKARLAASFGGPVIYLAVNYMAFGTFVPPDGARKYHVMLVSMAVTSVLWVLVSLLTKPDPEETLVAFYRRARPLGWWGPIARKAGVEPRGARLIPYGLVLAVVGAMMIAAGTIAFSSVYVGQWSGVAVFGCACLVAGAAFRTGYAGFMKRLDADAEMPETS